MMQIGQIASFVWEDSPLIAVAVHSGHAMRGELLDCLALDDAARLREEDPFTDGWTTVAPCRVVAQASRFQVDLNRPRDQAVYLRPQDAWGLTVWRKPPSPEAIERSLREHDWFYGQLRRLIEWQLERHPCVVVFDLHTYNHRRGGPAAAVADPEANPEVNVGTGTMDRGRWAAVVEQFQRDLKGFTGLGRRLDVRENVRFRGGYLPRWVHETFPDRGCALAIEVKKFFMDEWTAQADPHQLLAIRRALAGTVPGILEQLEAHSCGSGQLV